jgi:hypothetical protein
MVPLDGSGSEDRSRLGFVEGARLPHRRRYDFPSVPAVFGSTEDLVSYVEWLVSVVAEETGAAPVSLATYRRGWGIEPEREVISLDAFRKRADEFNLDDASLVLDFSVVDPEASLAVSLLHRAVGRRDRERVDIEGSQEPLVEKVKGRVKQDGARRVARVKQASAPVPPEHPRFHRARARLEERWSKLPGRESVKLTVTGALALVLGTLMLALIASLFGITLP